MKTLKNYLIIALMFIMVFAYKCHAQEGISISVLHDVKLGLGLDKEHNNGKSVMDLIVNVNLEGKQFEYHYFALQLQYERANLQDGYFNRYGVNAMWNLHSLIIPKLKLGFGAGLHMIERPDTGGLGSYSGTIELSYPIVKDLYIIAKNEWLRRPDLITPKLGYNLSAGLNYKF